MDPQATLIAVVAAAVVAGALLLVTWGLASSAARADVSAPAPTSALAVSLAGLVAFGLTFGWNFRPNESWRWMIWVFPAAGVLGALESRAATTSLARWTSRFALVAISIVLVLGKTLSSSGEHRDLSKLGLYFGLPLVLIAVWHALLPRLGALVGATALWMLASGTAGMLVLAHCINFGQIGGSIAGALGALIVACWLRPSPTGMAGAITPVAVFLSALVFLSFELAEPSFSRWSFALIALAPFLGMFSAKPVLRLILIAIPIAAALGIAFREYDTSVF